LAWVALVEEERNRMRMEKRRRMKVEVASLSLGWNDSLRLIESFQDFVG